VVFNKIIAVAVDLFFNRISEIINFFLFKKNLKIKVKNKIEDKQFLKFP
jgi:hypothetical protein